MLRLTVLGLLCAALAGCGVDRGRCLTSETRMVDESVQIATMPIPMGSGMTMFMPVYGTQRVMRTVCTRWEFPEGRP